MSQTPIPKNRFRAELQNLLSFGACEGISRGLNWGLMIILPILLLPEQYGLVGLIIPLIMAGGNLLRLGQNRTVLRYYSTETELPSFLYSQLLLWLLVSIASIAVLLGVAAVGPKTILGLAVSPYLLLTVGAVAISNLVYLGTTVARAEQNIGAFARFRLGENLGKVVAVLIMVYLYKSAQGYLVGYIIGTAAAGFFAFLFLMQRSSPPLLSNIKRKQYLLFGLPFVFHMIASNLLNYIGRFQIRAYLATEAVGIFTLATTVGFALTISATILAVYFEPKIYRQSGNQEASERWLAAFGWTALLLGTLGSLLALLAFPVILGRFYPEGYAGVIPLLAPLFAAALLRILYLQGNYRLALHEKPVWILSITIVSLVVHYLLNLVLIPSQGLAGAVLSYFISVMFLSLGLWTTSLFVTPTGPGDLKGKPSLALVVILLTAVGLFPSFNIHMWVFGLCAGISARQLFILFRRDQHLFKS